MDTQPYYMDDQQQELRPQPFINPINQFGSSIVTLTNPENELYKMELSLRNMMLDKDGKPRPVGEPLLNENGISSVVGQVQAIVNQTTVMSNFDRRQEIEIFTDFIGDTLAKDLMVNRFAYDIKTKSARDKVYYIALTSVYICMKRAFMEGEKRFWKGSQQEIKQTISSGQEGQGFIKRLLGFGQPR